MKLKNLLILLISIAVICSVALIMLKSVYRSPRSMFKRILGFELPHSAVIQNHETHIHLFGENEFYLKAHISKDDFHIISDEIDDSSQNGLTKMTQDDIVPNFENVCSWWDMNKDEVLLAYQRFEFGEYAKTNMLYVFLTQNTDGEYCLYVAN